MGNQIIKAPSGLDIQISYPDSLPSSLIGSASLRAVALIARYSIAAVRVVLQESEQSRIKFVFYDEYSRYLREDIIPTAALMAAHQSGRDWIKAMNLDPDLEADALTDFEKKRQKHRPR